MEQVAETTIVDNVFGKVTSKRVIYNRSKGWFGGGSREDIPLKHVTSVRLETKRSILSAILALMLGLVFVAGGSGVMFVCGAALLVGAVLMFWGSPSVFVNTSGNDLRPSKGAPWERSDADAFVDALREQIVRE